MPSYSFGPYLVRYPGRANSSRLSEPWKSNLLVRRLIFNSLNFLRNPQNPPRASALCQPHFVSRFIISSYCDISEWHVRSVRAHALPPSSRLHLTNPCAEPKGSQPNQTQRHEQKSLGYYITVLMWLFFLFPSFFSLVLYYNNHCSLFNAKPYSYIYFKYMIYIYTLNRWCLNKFFR